MDFIEIGALIEVYEQIIQAYLGTINTNMTYIYFWVSSRAWAKWILSEIIDSKAYSINNF